MKQTRHAGLTPLRLGFTLLGLCVTSFVDQGLAQGVYGSTYQIDGAFPLGVFAQSFKPGIGAHAEFYVESEGYLRFSVLGGFTWWNLDGDKINERYVADGGKGSLQLGGHMAAVPLMLGVKLLSPEGGLRVYGLLDLGMTINSGKVSGQRIENGSVTTTIDKSQTKLDLGLNLGGGCLLPVSKVVSIDFAARYHLVKRDTYYSYDLYGNPSAASTDKYITVSLGVTYAFSTAGSQ